VDSQASRVGAGDSRACQYSQRALSIWPSLDRRALSHCACDPQRIATVVTRRTSLPIEAIRSFIVGSTASPLEVETLVRLKRLA
jgi:hypothetical protein